MLRAVVESFKSHPEWSEWEKDFYVFDNQSSYGNTQDFLKSQFKNVFLSEENYGYWSAVNWFCNWAKQKGYEAVYITESDCVHFNLEQLSSAISLLENDRSVGMVRTQEFSVANKHFYDKSQRLPESKTCEWFQQYNVFTGQSAIFSQTQFENVYLVNLVAKVCGLHRIDAMIEVLSKLPVAFTEVDFQRIFYSKFTQNAILDGGMYNTTLSYAPEAMAGSFVQGEINASGYRRTREGFINSLEEMKVNFE